MIAAVIKRVATFIGVSMALFVCFLWVWALLLFAKNVIGL